MKRCYIATVYIYISETPKQTINWFKKSLYLAFRELVSPTKIKKDASQIRRRIVPCLFEI
jgi:hypothetical protein